MANYKSQYTGEQIDEAVGKSLSLDVVRIMSAVEKVETAPNIYNYDGTVIIEKAESVLGLRRFKETITPIEETYTTWEDLWNNYGFDIEPFSLDLGVLVEVQGLGCYIKTNSGEGVLCKNYNPDFGYDYTITSLEEMAQLGITQFNILSTANSTVDEWLLANTEGVSV